MAQKVRSQTGCRGTPNNQMGKKKILSRMSNDVLRLRAGKGSIKLWGGVGWGRAGEGCVGGGLEGGGGWGDFRSNALLSPPE